MTAVEVTLIATGAANLASVRAAFARVGAGVRVTTDADHVCEAPLVVLPGVGAFGPAMDGLTQRGLDAALRQRVAEGRPLLAICLGFQLLAEASEEAPGAAGLGLIPGIVRRFPCRADLRVPQFGWNRVSAASGVKVLDRAGAAYFANSYRLAEPPPGYGVAWADHGGPFVAGVERGALVACQFHPELSGPYGQRLLAQWLASNRAPEEVT